MSGFANSQSPIQQREMLIRRYGVAPGEADHNTLARMIEDMLNKGLRTKIVPFPEDDRAFAAILDQLRKLSADDLRQKLVISGWLLKPYGADQTRCQECMYYLVNRRWCDLPD